MQQRFQVCFQYHPLSSASVCLHLGAFFGNFILGNLYVTTKKSFLCVMSRSFLLFLQSDVRSSYSFLLFNFGKSVYYFFIETNFVCACVWLSAPDVHFFHPFIPPSLSFYGSFFSVLATCLCLCSATANSGGGDGSIPAVYLAAGKGDVPSIKALLAGGCLSVFVCVCVCCVFGRGTCLEETPAERE